MCNYKICEENKINLQLNMINLLNVIDSFFNL